MTAKLNIPKQEVLKATFIWPLNENARTKQKQQTKARKQSNMTGLLNGYKRAWLFGWQSECSGEKTLCLRTF